MIDKKGTFYVQAASAAACREEMLKQYSCYGCKNLSIPNHDEVYCSEPNAGFEFFSAISGGEVKCPWKVTNE